MMQSNDGYGKKPDHGRKMDRGLSLPCLLIIPLAMILCTGASASAGEAVRRVAPPSTFSGRVMEVDFDKAFVVVSERTINLSEGFDFFDHRESLVDQNALKEGQFVHVKAIRTGGRLTKPKIYILPGSYHPKDRGKYSFMKDEPDPLVDVPVVDETVANGP